MLSTKFSRHFAKYRPLIPVVWSANIHVARNDDPLVEAFSEYCDSEISLPPSMSIYWPQLRADIVSPEVIRKF